MITPPSFFQKALVVAATASWFLLPGAAHAIFEDGDARRAILELRSRADQTKLIDQNQTAEIQQLRSSLLELQSQISALSSDLATLRGEKEELAEQLKRQQESFDERLKSFEPQTVQMDGASFQAQSSEQKEFEAALDLLRNGQYEKSRDAFIVFLKNHPKSGYTASANFWLGNNYYATRQYQKSIEAFNAMLTEAPQHERAPQAMLSIAQSQFELKNVAGAKKTLQNLIKVYPSTDSAKEAKSRLSRLR